MTTPTPKKDSEKLNQTLARLKELHRKMAHLPPIDDAFIRRAKRAGRLGSGQLPH